MDIITSIALGLFRGLWFLIHREAESAAFAVDWTPLSTGVSSVRATPGHSARFLAALRSRSKTRPQASQRKTRSPRGISIFTCPHLEHLFVDGYHLSAVIRADPYQRVLYRSCLEISPQAASPMALARWWFPIMFFTSRSSTTIAGLVFASIVVNFWMASRRVFATLMWRRASASLARLRFDEPFFLRLRLRCRCLSFLSYLRSTLGFSSTVPSLTTAREFSPRSTPTTGPGGVIGSLLSSTTTLTATYHRLARSETVTELMCALEGM